jgi:hypothetical protein
MSVRNGFRLSLLLFFALVGRRQSVGQEVQAAPKSASELHILFTDYLLGYYRIPEQQGSDFLKAGECQNPEPQTPAERLEKAIADSRTSNTILLGMGDNFAVDLWSRTYKDDKGMLVAKSRGPNPKHLWPGPTGPIADNVSCFFWHAKYDALAPGKEDFYFGAKRLQLNAQQMADSKDHAVHMLAANLTVQTDFRDKVKDVPDSLKNLAYETNMPDGVESLDIGDGDTVLPFLATIRFTVAPPFAPPLIPRLCEAAQNNPDVIDLKHCQDLTSPTGDSAYHFPHALVEDQNYGLCVNSLLTKATLNNYAATRAGDHCLRFHVSRPYFRSAKCTAWDHTSCNYDLPYVYLKDKQVVIFGVVDPDFRAMVGRDNLSMQNQTSSEKYKTEVTVLEPAVALRQALNLFVQNEGPLPRYTVLLAEMDRDKAEELASHLNFDVVLTHGAGYEHATTNRTVSIPPDLEGLASKQKSAYRAAVIVPWQGFGSYNGERKLLNPLRELVLTDSFAGGAPTNRTIVLSGEHKPLDDASYAMLKEQYDDLACRQLNAHGYLCACLQPVGNSSQCPNHKYSVGEAFRTATLAFMRESTNADLALMESRDFYFGPFHPSSKDSVPSNGPPRAEDFERILWRGDLVRVIPVTGASLKKVLDESDAFASLDKKTTRFSSEPGRALSRFGIVKTSDEDYLVNGQLLDPGRIYMVATTNHINTGDTGYPELNDPALGDKTLPEPASVATSNHEQGNNRRVSELICSWMDAQGCVHSPDVLFASESQMPSHSEPGAAQRLADWARHIGPPELEKPNEAPEQLVQERPTWRLSLKELSADLSRAHNNLSTADTISRLSAVSEPGAGAKNSHSIGFATKAEWVRSGASWDEFVRGQMEYSVTVTAQTTQVNNVQVRVPPAISRDKNKLMSDMGFFLHGFQPHKSDPKWGLVLEPLHFETPLHQEQIFVDPHFDTTGVLDRQAFTVDLERTRLLLPRLGIRFEGAGNHFELGYQGGWERNALDFLTFTNGSSPALITCAPEADKSVQECLNDQGAAIDPNSIVQHRDTRIRHGIYADVGWSLALVHNLKFNVQDQGGWFAPAHNDNSTDTLYRNDATMKLTVPVFGNFSFEPGIELFSYENKVAHTHLFRVSPVLKVNFSFDQYSGGKWKKALWYKAGGSGD